MRVLHAPAWYPPHSIGGTEIYVRGLVAELQTLGAKCVIAIPHREGLPRLYQHEGVDVITYPVNDQPSRRELRGLQPPAGMKEFRAILGGGFDIYHQHALSRGCGLAHLLAAREAGLPTVLTVHTPNATCLRGTMMRQGKTPCDGRIDVRQCSPCWASERGAPRCVASATALVPVQLAGAAASLSGSGLPEIAARALTLISANDLVAAKRRDIATLRGAADVVIAVCDWLEQALVTNGLEKDQLMRSRQGVDVALAAELQVLRRAPIRAGERVSFGFIGRWHKTKGIDLAIRAFRRLSPAVNARLSIYATAQGSDGEAYRDQCLAIASSDARISIYPAFTRAQLPAVLAGMDALLIPSRWLETGPLVALEAMAAGVWVIGSAIGGLPELVAEGKNGTLVPADDEASWTRTINEFICNPQQPVRAQIRTMSDVASDMAKVYSRLRDVRMAAIGAG